MNGACPPPEQFVDLLACPVCHSELRYAPAPAGDGPGTYGILTCGNHSFPYLDGVAVLTGGTIDVHVQIGDSLIQRGPDVREVVARIRAGRGADALADLLTPQPRHRPGSHDCPAAAASTAAVVRANASGAGGVPRLPV